MCAYDKTKTRLWRDDWSRESGSWRKNNWSGSGEPSYQHLWYCTLNWSLGKRSLACVLEWRITSLPSFEGSASAALRLWMSRRIFSMDHRTLSPELIYSIHRWMPIHSTRLLKCPYWSPLGWRKSTCYGCEKFSRQIRSKVRCGFGDRLIGPRIFGQSLNADRYLNFQQNDFLVWIENFDLELRKNHVYMQDGAPPHWARIIKTYLYEHFPYKWIGFGSLYVQWTSRSPQSYSHIFLFMGPFENLSVSNPYRIMRSTCSTHSRCMRCRKSWCEHNTKCYKHCSVPFWIMLW